LPYPTAETATIVTAARGLMAAAMPMIERRGLTLVGLALTNLEHGDAVQLSLPLDYDRRSALDAAIDDVRERFGASAITRAVLLGHQGEPRSLADAS
jgi:DNA polymerase IV